MACSPIIDYVKGRAPFLHGHIIIGVIPPFHEELPGPVYRGLAILAFYPFGHITRPANGAVR